MHLKPELLLVCLLLCCVATAQTTEHYYNYKWERCKPEEALFYSSVTKTDSGWYRRDYYIRERKLHMAGLYKDEECKIPNGTFYYFYPNTYLSSTGRYKEGKQEGIWLSYHFNQLMQDSAIYIDGDPIGEKLSWYPNGYLRDSSIYRADGSGLRVSWFSNGVPSSAGMFAGGRQPDKKWVYFHKNGTASNIELYDKGKLVSRQLFDSSGTLLADATDIEKEAEFSGGQAAWMKYLQKHLYFPAQYKFENGVKAVVIVSFSISEEGKVEDVYVSTSLHPAFDAIAENVIKRSPGWIPALSKNRNVRSYRRQPVTFGQPE